MKTAKVQALPVLSAAAGIAFCLLSVFKVAHVLCVTQGCGVYEGLSVAGVSLYWFGAAAFGILLICSFVWGGEYLAVTAAIFLILDMGFLVIQILLWPCMQCLIVAALFGAVMYSAMTSGGKTWMRGALIVWFLLFTVNVVSAGKEAVTPWPVYGTNAAPVRLFFSPSCPACREMIADLPVRPDIPAAIALYPIAKNVGDVQRIMTLGSELRRGKPLKEALDSCEQAAVGPVTYNTSFLRTLWETLRNMSALSRAGVTRIPFLTATAPFWSDASRSPQSNCPMFSSDTSGQCSDSSAGALKNIFLGK